MRGKTKVINITSGAPYDVYIGWQRPAWMGGRGYYLPRSPWRNPYNKAYRDGHITVREAIELSLYDLLVTRPDSRMAALFFLSFRAG